MKSLLVHKHFLELNALISHTLVVRCAIGCLSDTLGLNLGLNQEVVSLRVDPNAVVLHNNLLKDTLLERLPEFYGLQSEGIMQRHLILQEAVFIPVGVIAKESSTDAGAGRKASLILRGRLLCEESWVRLE